jgi:cytochrome c oxidase subunit 2
MTSTLFSIWAWAQDAAGTGAPAASEEPAAPQGLSESAVRALHEGGSYWMPADGSTHTLHTDWLYYGILGLTLFCFAGIAIAVVYFTWRYRARPGHEAEDSSAHNDALEITWTIIPSIICVFIFIWGWQGFVNIQTTPKNALEVKVTAQKWKWLFEYEGLAIPVGELHVPVGRPVRLVMTSQDVLHSFYVPAFRTKQDIIPYRYTKIWFEATTPGTYRLFCTEYCGDDHSMMKTVAIVHERGGFEKWQQTVIKQTLGKLTPAERGKWFYDNLGCANCHSVDGSPGKGPSFLGVWGKTEQTSQGAVKVDENYIRESIVDPNAKVVTGYGPIMPTFRGKIEDEYIGNIIDYIKSLQGAPQ